MASTLVRILSERTNGLITSVPVLGTGLNVQAARLNRTEEDDWAGLLARITVELGLSAESLGLPKSHLFRWESMLRAWARIKAVEPFQAESQLQQLTCRYLRSLEPIASQRSLYLEFSSARFTNIISLNFDRRIALSFSKTSFQSAPVPCPEGSHGEALYRHDLLVSADGSATRIWYPHGDTKKSATLKLGVRKYGFYVGILEEAIENRGDEWRVRRSYHDEREKRRKDEHTPSWVDSFVKDTVIFIGCGLSFDEWPLWAMLRRRARTRYGQLPWPTLSPPSTSYPNSLAPSKKLVWRSYYILDSI
jgi:hypothetical protein